MSNFPKDLKYTSEHEWVRVEGNEIVVGITDFAQKELGDIVFVELDTINQLLEAEQIFGSIEAVKTVSDLFMPTSGTIFEVNKALESHPELINSDPYGEGWIIKIKDLDMASLDNLLSEKDYKNIIP